MATPNLALIPSAYKARVVYSVLPNNGVGDFTFIRSGNATRINKDGLIETVDSHVPRLNYDLYQGKPKQCPSLLLEPSSTNLVTYSEDFSQWSSLGSPSPTITTNFAISPDGTQNASRYVVNSSSASTRLELGAITVSAASHTFSLYIKNNTGNNSVKLNVYDGSDNNQTFTATDTWQRISYTLTTSATSSCFLSIRTSGDADFLIYGAQFEQQSYSTSYIPTSGSTETRNEEECNNAGNSGTFNDSEGVLFLDTAAFNDSSIWRGITISDGTLLNRIAYYATGRGNANEIRFDIITNGAFQTLNYVVLNDITNYNKIAIKYNTNNVSGWINGFRVFLDTTATMPTGLSNLGFGNGLSSNPAEKYFGKTKEIGYYDTALTDSQLEYLTSYRSFGDMVESQNYIIQ